MDLARVVVKGDLLKAPRVGTMTLKSKTFKPYFFQLVVGGGAPRLEGYESATELRSTKYLIPLSTVVRCKGLGAYTKFEQGAFEVVTGERTWILVANDEDAMMQWVTQISQLLAPAGLPVAQNMYTESESQRRQTMPLPEVPSVRPSSRPAAPTAPAAPTMTLLQENLAYMSVSPDTSFQVTVTSTPDAEKLALSGPAIISISTTAITITPQVLKGARSAGACMWPLRYLRRYGAEETLPGFSFEAGRKCDTGPGAFVVTSPEFRKIYRLVDENSRALAGTGLQAATLPPVQHSPSPPRHAPAPDSTYAQLQRPSTWVQVETGPVKRKERQYREDLYGDPTGGVPGLYEDVPLEYARDEHGHFIVPEDMSVPSYYADISEIQRRKASAASGKSESALSLQEIADLGYADPHEIQGAIITQNVLYDLGYADPAESRMTRVPRTGSHAYTEVFNGMERPPTSEDPPQFLNKSNPDVNDSPRKGAASAAKSDGVYSEVLPH